METVYKKYRPACNILMEYYAYDDLRKIIRQDWEAEDEKFKKQCDKLYDEYELAAADENRRAEFSKSAKVAKKLEALKVDYSDTILLKKLKK